MSATYESDPFSSRHELALPALERDVGVRYVRPGIFIRLSNARRH